MVGFPAISEHHTGTEADRLIGRASRAGRPGTGHDDAGVTVNRSGC